MKIRKAVIPAAGLGTRFLPFTKSTPKEMLPIIDTPAIELLVKEATLAGITDVLIILGRNKNSIEDHFDVNVELEKALLKNNKLDELKKINSLNELANIYFIRQHNALGLGHAVLQAKTFVGDEPFLLLLGDELIDNEISASKQLIDAYYKNNSTTIGLKEVPKEEVNKYGIANLNSNTVTELVEKPSIENAPSNLAIIGRYVIDSIIFEILENTLPGKGGEIQLTDALITLMNKKEIYGQKIIGERFDTGSKLGYVKSIIHYALKDQDIKDEILEYIKELRN